MKKKTIIGEDGKEYSVKEKKPFYKRWWFIVIAGIFLLGIIGSLFCGSDTDSKPVSSGKSTESKTTEQEEAMSVSAIDLAKAYDENEVAADKMYKDKLLAVSGKISDISVTFDTPQITLESSDAMFLNVLIGMKSDEGMESLTKGQEITIIGTCDGSNGLTVNLTEGQIQQ